MSFLVFAHRIQSDIEPGSLYIVLLLIFCDLKSEVRKMQNEVVSEIARVFREVDCKCCYLLECDEMTVFQVIPL